MRIRTQLAVLAVALPLSGCGLFTKQNARTTNDAAKALCELRAQAIKPGITAEEIAETFCKDLRPWLDHVLALQQVGLPRPAAAPAP